MKNIFNIIVMKTINQLVSWVEKDIQEMAVEKQTPAGLRASSFYFPDHVK